MTINNTLRDDPKLFTTLGPAARTATANGATVDLATFKFPSLHAIVGTITDGTHTLDPEEADDDGSGVPDTWSNIAAADLEGGAFAVLASDVNQSRVYQGTKRFVRVSVTISGASTGGVYAVGAELARGASSDL
jgi:hypothetical protein